MILQILRGIFILLAAAVTALYLVPNQQGASVQFGQFVLITSVVMGIAAVVIAVDVFSRKKKLSALSGIFLGLIGGLVAAYAVGGMVDLIEVFDMRPKGVDKASFHNLLEGVKVFVGLITCYISMSVVLQTKDDFRFILPYIEFAKQVRGNRPILLDTSVIIDGRVLDLLETKIFQGTLVVPKFVLDELQQVADSADKLKRGRGRRGLEILQKLQENTAVDVVINESVVDGTGVDQKLVALAQQEQARVMTNDFNLNKVATLRGVDVINLNDLAKAMKPVVLPGEGMRVRVVKPGEGANQGVGYLEDGTMVVIENARSLQGQEIEIVVTSTIQTSAGRMIFGRAMTAGEESQVEPAAPAAPAPPAESVTAKASFRATGPSARNPRRN